MGIVHIVAFILLVVGGLNWLAYALVGLDIGSFVGGMDSLVAKIIYVLVGLAAIFEVATHRENCRACAAMKGGMGGGIS